jgi:general secretion pathway protein B
MSYILEALKKAEQERQLGQVPRLTHSHHTPLFQGAAETLPLQRAAGWLLGSLLIISIVAASLGHWFAQQWQPTPQISTTFSNEHTQPSTTTAPINAIAAADKTQHTTNPPATLTLPTVSPLAQQQSPATGPILTKTTLAEQSKPLPKPEPAQTLTPAPEPKATSKAELKTAEPLPRVIKPSPMPTQPPTVPNIAEHTVILLHELPPNIQQRLLPLKINVHVYATEPAQRFVLINGQRYREGMQLIDKPIKLLQIRPDDIILSYQTWHIRLNPL